MNAPNVFVSLHFWQWIIAMTRTSMPRNTKMEIQMFSDSICASYVIED